MEMGKTEMQKWAEERQTARQIVREISQFGVNDNQILLIIELLALELSETQKMRDIVELVKNLTISPQEAKSSILVS